MGDARKVFCIFGIQWVMPEKVASLLFGWRNWLGDVWNLVHVVSLAGM